MNASYRSCINLYFSIHFSPLVDTKAFGWMHATEVESIFWFAFILQRDVRALWWNMNSISSLLFFFCGLNIGHDSIQFISIVSLMTWLPQVKQGLAFTKLTKIGNWAVDSFFFFCSHNRTVLNSRLHMQLLHLRWPHLFR